jgi:hypothetical protein
MFVGQTSATKARQSAMLANLDSSQKPKLSVALILMLTILNNPVRAAVRPRYGRTIRIPLVAGPDPESSRPDRLARIIICRSRVSRCRSGAARLPACWASDEPDIVIECA